MLIVMRMIIIKVGFVYRDFNGMNKITYKMQTDLTQLYQAHQAWLSIFLRKRLHCSHQAADLLQDTYLKILVSGKIPPEEYARQYLTRVAKGLLVDQARRWRIEQAYLDTIRQLPEVNQESPEHRLQTIETLIEVDELLHNLPEKARQAFLLRRIEGLSYRTIAEQLKVSVSSVEKYIARGLAACTIAMLKHNL